MGGQRSINMKYISTRDKTGTQRSFKTVVMQGLAKDSGLFVPAEVEALRQSAETIKAWSELDSYSDLAVEVMTKFIDEDDVPRADLQRIVGRSYVPQSASGNWSDDKIVPVVKLDEEQYPGVSVLEQFHGPTCAFKDVALQFLGNLFEYFLGQEPGKTVTVVGATSGDTGGAAIEGLRGKKNVQVCMLHPEGKVAKLQKLQMISVLDKNVHNMAVDGDFDDCQAIVKKLFVDDELKEKLMEKGGALAAVNSINWARILAQIVYYFSAYFQWCKLHNKTMMQDQVDFIVPSGNFGNALAGYYAKLMGCPIRKLIIATNHNDILHRLISSKDFSKKKSRPSVAPAMDITVPSNFERYLFLLSGSDPEVLSGWMKDVADNKGLELTSEQYEELQTNFGSGCASDDDIKAMRDKLERTTGITFCTHSAVGLHVAIELEAAKASDVICLATAHHGKFGDTVEESQSKSPPMPPQLANLESKVGRCMSCPNSAETVKQYLYEYVINDGEQSKTNSSAFTLLAGVAAVLAIGGAYLYK